MLLKLYAELKRRWCGDSFPRIFRESSRKVIFFKRAAVKLSQLQERGYPADTARFAWAVFSYFGAGTFPEHFVSEKVWKMYFAWEERRQLVVKKGVRWKHEEDTLDHLCAARAEPLRVVWPIVRNSGVFTSKFITHIDEVVRRQTRTAL